MKWKLGLSYLPKIWLPEAIQHKNSITIHITFFTSINWGIRSKILTSICPFSGKCMKVFDIPSWFVIVSTYKIKSLKSLYVVFQTSWTEYGQILNSLSHECLPIYKRLPTCIESILKIILHSCQLFENKWPSAKTVCFAQICEM